MTPLLFNLMMLALVALVILNCIASEMELTIMAQHVPQLLVAWLLLHWFVHEAKRVTALAVASQRKRAP